MKILRVITRMNIGGPALQAVELTKRLPYNTTLLYGQIPDGEKQLDSPVVRPLNKIHILVRELSLSKDFQTFLLLRKLIKIHKPDIVHTHMSKAGALTRLAAITIRNRPKLVHTYHGTVLDEYFGWFKSWVFKHVERFLAKYTDALIAISPRQHHDITTKYKIANGSKVRIIRLGFDLSRFDEMYRFGKESSKPEEDNTVRIGIVGRVAPVKNHKYFIELLAELKPMLSRQGKELVGYVIGGGKKQDIDNLSKLAKVRKVTIIFCDYISHDYMPLYYSMLDLVLCTSKNEGTPVSLIEAMATGVDVESVNVGDVCDVMELYPLLEVDDNPDIAAGFLYRHHFRLGPITKRLMLEDTQKRTLERYNIDRLVEDIKKLYEELVK